MGINLDTTKTCIEIVNEVQTRLGLNTTVKLDSTKHSTMLLGLLNNLLDDISDYGDWQEMYSEQTVSAVSSLGEYPLDFADPIKKIEEISFDNQVSPLEVRDKAYINRLQRGRSFGAPRHFAIVGLSVNTGNPIIRVAPIPRTNEDGALFTVCFYKKASQYTTSDGGEDVPFPSRMVIQGLYAKALLRENGGEPTDQYKTEYQIFLKMLEEACNRFNADTGTDTYLVPAMGGRG